VLYSYDLYSYDLYSYDLHSYDLRSYDLQSYICQLTAWAAVNMDPWYSLYKSFFLKKVGIYRRYVNADLNLTVMIVILLLLLS